jgi:hypothetical protein
MVYIKERDVGKLFRNFTLLNIDHYFQMECIWYDQDFFKISIRSWIYRVNHYYFFGQEKEEKRRNEWYIYELKGSKTQQQWEREREREREFEFDVDIWPNGAGDEDRFRTSHFRHRWNDYWYFLFNSFSTLIIHSFIHYQTNKRSLSLSLFSSIGF